MRSAALETSPMVVLKRRTRGSHETLEARLDLLAPALDRVRYGQLLARFALVQPALEDGIAAVAGSAIGTFDVDGRRKTAALHDDLRMLGIEPPTPHALAVRITSVPAAVGALYVTEGATLGGALISGHVAAVLGDDVPRAFFTSYGAAVPARWAEFRALAHAELVSPAQLEEASVTAAAVFDWFIAVLAP